MKWTPERDQELFLILLARSRTQPDYERAAKDLRCSKRAIEERLKKLRKQAKERGDIDFSSLSLPESPLNEEDISRQERRKARRRRQTVKGAFKSETRRHKRMILEESGSIDEDAPLINRYYDVDVDMPAADRSDGFHITAEGVQIPLGVPLEVSEKPLVSEDHLRWPTPEGQKIEDLSEGEYIEGIIPCSGCTAVNLLRKASPPIATMHTTAVTDNVSGLQTPSRSPDSPHCPMFAVAVANPVFFGSTPYLFAAEEDEIPHMMDSSHMQDGFSGANYPPWRLEMSG